MAYVLDRHITGISQNSDVKNRSFIDESELLFFAIHMHQMPDASGRCACTKSATY